MTRNLLLAAAVLLVATACKSRPTEQELDAQRFVVSMDNAAAAEGRPVCPNLTKLSTNAYLNECDKQVSEDKARLADLEARAR